MSTHRTVSHSAFHHTNHCNNHKQYKIASENSGLRELIGNNEGYFNATIGTQSYFTPLSLLSGPQVLDVTNANSVAARVQAAYSTTESGAQHPLEYITMGIEEIDAEVFFTNQSSSNILLELYDCLPKHDMTNSGPIRSQTAITLMDPLSLMVEGTVDVGVSTTSASLNTLGHTPFMVPGFTMNWNVKKSHKLYLAPGQSHIHHVKLHPQFATQAIQWDAATALYFFKDRTYYCLARAHGFPMHSTTGPDASSLPAIAISVINCARYKYCWAPGETPEIKISNVLGSTISTVSGQVNSLVGTAIAPFTS